MEIIILAALITAYLAGIAALFAPCCIGVLLPAYFGSIFRQKRTVVAMTLVFFLGLLVVFLPLGLGVGFIGQLLKMYHGIIYTGAGLFFLVLAGIILSGYHMSIPFKTKSQVKVTGGISVFVLGIFSGFATLCCAPVLAGALALSVLPGSVLLGGLYSVVYVVGMVSPLFIISYYLDKKGIMEKINFFKKEVSYSLFGKNVSLTLSNVFSGIVFVVMGTILLVYSLTNRIAMTDSDNVLWVNIMISKLNDLVTSFMSNVFGQVSFFVLMAVLLVILIRKLMKYWRKAE